MVKRWRFNGCRFDPEDGRLSSTLGAESVSLRPQAARLLSAFLDDPGQVLTKESLINAVWDDGAVVDFESGLAALMRELRQALDQLGAGSDLIETVPRRGYRFHGQPDDMDSRLDSKLTDSWSWRMVLPALFILFVGAAGLLWLKPLGMTPSPTATAVDGTATLAILPFEVFVPEPASEDRIGLLMADALLARLWAAELNDLDLIGRATLRPYQAQDQVAMLVARDLGVSLIVEGAVSLAANDVWTVDARLLHMPQGTVVWSESITLIHPDAIPAREVADQLIRQLSDDWVEILRALNQSVTFRTIFEFFRGLSMDCPGQQAHACDSTFAFHSGNGRLPGLSGGRVEQYQGVER